LAPFSLLVELIGSAIQVRIEPVSLRYIFANLRPPFPPRLTHLPVPFPIGCADTPMAGGPFSLFSSPPHTVFLFAPVLPPHHSDKRCSLPADETFFLLNLWLVLLLRPPPAVFSPPTYYRTYCDPSISIDPKPSNIRPISEAVVTLSQPSIHSSAQFPPILHIVMEVGFVLCSLKCFEIGCSRLGSPPFFTEGFPPTLPFLLLFAF